MCPNDINEKATKLLITYKVIRRRKKLCGCHGPDTCVYNVCVNGIGTSNTHNIHKYQIIQYLSVFIYL